MSGLTKKEIELLYKKGRKFFSENFIFFFLPSDELKVAIVVSKKISKKAVVRNRIKRRLRHLCREFLQKGSFVIVTKRDVSKIEFEKLKNDFKKIIYKIN